MEIVQIIMGVVVGSIAIGSALSLATLIMSFVGHVATMSNDETTKPRIKSTSMFINDHRTEQQQSEQKSKSKIRTRNTLTTSDGEELLIVDENYEPFRNERS